MTSHLKCNQSPTTLKFRSQNDTRVWIGRYKISYKRLKSQTSRLFQRCYPEQSYLPQTRLCPLKDTYSLGKNKLLLSESDESSNLFFPRWPSLKWSSLNKYQGGHHTTVTIQFILIVLEYEHSWKERSHVEQVEQEVEESVLRIRWTGNNHY